MDHYEIVRKLIGPIEPIGETQTDNERYENLIAMGELAERLIADIRYVAVSFQNNHQASMRKASQKAYGLLDELGL